MTTDYVALVQEVGAGMKDLAGSQPEVMGAFQAMKAGSIKDGALTAKVKELIALALAVGSQCEPCIGFHAQACVKYGVTREEVADMLGVCVLMGGGPKLMYTTKALAAYDQFKVRAA